MLSLYELKKILNPKQDSTPEDDFLLFRAGPSMMKNLQSRRRKEI